MYYALYFLNHGSWMRAMEFVTPSRITESTRLYDGKIMKHIHRKTFEEAKKAAAPYFEKGYAVKITEVK